MSDCLTFLIKFITDLFKVFDNNYVTAGVSLLGVMIVFYMLYTIIDRFYPKG